MSKKYKLLKDHPYAKAGTEVIFSDFIEDCIECAVILPDEYKTIWRFLVPLSVEKEWLEPVETRWKPKGGEIVFFINGNLKAMEELAEVGWVDYKDRFPNLFRTREIAEEAAKRVKACLEAYHEEIGE